MISRALYLITPVRHIVEMKEFFPPKKKKKCIHRIRIKNTKITKSMDMSEEEGSNTNTIKLPGSCRPFTGIWPGEAPRRMRLNRMEDVPSVKIREQFRFRISECRRWDSRMYNILWKILTPPFIEELS